MMYTVEPGCLHDTYEVRGLDGYICLTTNKPDARRIAHALNHHDALVDALERTTGELERIDGGGEGTPSLEDIANARAALAAAKGEHHAD